MDKIGKKYAAYGFESDIHRNRRKIRYRTQNAFLSRQYVVGVCSIIKGVRGAVVFD